MPILIFLKVSVKTLRKKVLPITLAITPGRTFVGYFVCKVTNVLEERGRGFVSFGRIAFI